MLMTLKNKLFLTMDKLISEASNKGGIPANFVLDPQETANFLREIKEAKPENKKRISVRSESSDTVDIRFLLKAELTNERLTLLIEQLHDKNYIISYKGIDIKVTPNKKEVVSLPIPPEPEAPPLQMVIEHSLNTCEFCGSSVHRKWGIFGIDGCIQPECKNYYGK